MVYKNSIRILFFLIFISWAVAQSAENETVATNISSDSTVVGKSPIFVTYGSKGWEFGTSDGNYLLQFQSRLQFRYANPWDTNPVTFDDFNKEPQNVLKINRARLKIGGNVYQPWLKYYWEYELAAGNLLDFRVMIEKESYFKVKVGQWKVQYNRERVISSGKQQMADRSLINRAFTVDRQQGVSLYGRLQFVGLADFNYWASLFTGTGRGSTTNDDKNMMYMIRGQWNFLGQQLAFVGSDIKYHENGAGLLALAAVTNQSPYTRFSQAGGGQLHGFEAGEPGQYRVNQCMVETALMVRGFSWQQELHWKEINDKKNNNITILLGNYFQLGYFLHHLWTWVPKPLEIAVRHAIYDPDRNQSDNLQQEISLALNWFFNGHNNKLTAEISHFDFQEDIENEVDGYRFRIQWDISM